MQRLAPSDDDPDGDNAVCVERFEGRQIAIVKRVLVVPLDFECEHAGPKPLYVVDLVGIGLSLKLIDDLSHTEGVSLPTAFGKGSSEPLGTLGLAATRADDLDYWYGGGRENILKLSHGVWHVAC